VLPEVKFRYKVEILSEANIKDFKKERKKTLSERLLFVSNNKNTYSGGQKNMAKK
jgi:hypothetical protein